MDGPRAGRAGKGMIRGSEHGHTPDS